MEECLSTIISDWTTPGTFNDKRRRLLADRPESTTAIGNLFSAGDWVRTNINVTTMQGANEGARQAVNALLDVAGSVAPRCSLRGLFRPPEFEHLKSVDRARYREAQPNLFDIDDRLLP